MTRRRGGCRRCGLIRWLSCPAGSRRLTLEGAEGGLPAVELVIESLDAVLFGPGLEGFADFEDAVHAGGVPGDGELLEGALGVAAGGLGIVLGCRGRGQVAEDDGALLVVVGGRVGERGGQGLVGLGEVPGLELGVAFEGGQAYGGEPGEPEVYRAGSVSAWNRSPPATPTTWTTPVVCCTS